MNGAVFYSGTKNASSWAMRAWLALRAAEFPFREEVIDIRRPQRFQNLRRIGQFSPPAAVPVLVVDENVIFDSLAIMEFANDVSGNRLLPEDTVTRARARSIVAWQHSGLSAICARISFESSFYPSKRALTADEVAQCARLFNLLDYELRLSGGPWLFGDISLADFMLVPAMVRLTRHRIDLSAWPRVKDWTNALLSYEHVAEWMAKADQLPHIWLEDYL